MSRIEELIKEKCPDGVVYRKISEICNISRGKVMSKDYIRENAGEYPVYSSQTENNGELGRISTYEYEGEYLTWTTDGANAGTVFHREGKFSVTNVCGLLKIQQKDVICKYLFYALSLEAPEHVNQGMGNAKLMSNVMADIEIPVPPIEVQQEIVRVLDKFIELEVELQAELDARRKQYEFYYNMLLVENTIDCVEVRLQDICEFVTVGIANSATHAYAEEGIVLLRNQNIRENILDDTDLIYITPEFAQKYKSKSLKHNDILATRTGYPGQACLVPSKYEGCQTFTTLIARLKNFEITNPKYICYYINSKSGKQYVEKMKTGAAQQNFGAKVFENMPIKVPPIEKQDAIVKMLDKFNLLCNDYEKGLPAEIEARHKQYEYYRDKLLTFERKVV